jgi:hypothetical protein
MILDLRLKKKIADVVNLWLDLINRKRYLFGKCKNASEMKTVWVRNIYIFSSKKAYIFIIVCEKYI